MDTDVSQSQPVSEINSQTVNKPLNVIPNVLCQHADAAASLALDRFYALDSSNYNLTDLKKHESRLEANLDGLFISGNEGWPFYKKHLSAMEYGEIFTNTVLSIKLRDSERFESNFVAADKDETLLNAIADAFVWLPFDEVSSYLDLLYNLKKPEKQFVAIAAWAGHRQINLTCLQDALSSTYIPLRQRALIAVSELGEENLVTILKKNFDHENWNIQFAACWSLTRFGHADAMLHLKSFLSQSVYAERAIYFLVMQKNIDMIIALLRVLFEEKNTKRLAIYGMGLLGNPKSIDALIQLMDDPELARVAGEAFSFMTGVDLDYEDLNQSAPDTYESGPNEEPKNENVSIDPDEDLPWPNPELISQWWQQNKNRFQDNKRYVLGKDESVAQYKNVLINGTQKQRAFAALVIAVHQQNQPIFNVYAPAKRQMKLLGISD